MAKTCNAAPILEQLGKKWTLTLLRSLDGSESKRFNALLTELKPLSARTLAKRLEELISCEILSRTEYNEIPPRVEYALTKKGEDLVKCFKPIDAWMEKYT